MKFTNPQLGILASGRGSNFEAIQKAIEHKDLPANVAVVISDQADAGALSLAKKYGIPAISVANETKATRDLKILEILKKHSVDVIVLAGWLKLVSPPLLDAFPERIINIHPGPLPRFGGKRMYGHYVHEAVLKAGVKDSGPTVHLVDEKFDHGKILAHTPVPVLPNDTSDSLAKRVLPKEHDLYWRVIKKQFCN